MLIQSFKNRKAGVEAHVCIVKMKRGHAYTVDVFDVEAREFRPEVKVFDFRLNAEKYARRAAGQDQGGAA